MIAAPLILVVEDDPSVADVLDAMLRAGGYRTRTVDGPSAAEAVRELQPDAVLLDLWMPDIRGEEIYTLLQADEATRHIPVIIASAVPSAAAHAQTLGVAAVLAKPFSLRLLLDTVGTLVTAYHNRPHAPEE